LTFIPFTYSMQEVQRVIIIGPAHPLRGGLASYNERLAKAFNEKGFRTTIYTFSLQYPGFLFPGTSQYSSEPAPSDLEIRVRINSVNPFNWIMVGQELRMLKPDIVVVRFWLPFMGPCLGTILRFVKGKKNCKVICIADNIIPHEKRPGDIPFTRYFVAAVDGFVTMSKKVLGDLGLFTRFKPAVFVPHPLYDNFGAAVPMEAARKHLGLDPEENLILFFGFIRPYKGLDLLLKAMAMQPIRDARLKLLIAGEFYDQQQSYLNLIHELNLHQRVILRTQFIPDSEVRYYLCAANLVVQPYRSATQSGVTPLAYHFEKPMVVTNVGALPDMVPEGKVGLVCEPDPASLAETIARYFTLNEQVFIEGIREEKKQYTWDRMVDNITKMAHDIQK
jgi:glycosyltransferase involved in cell wall biosynthesis